MAFSTQRLKTICYSPYNVDDNIIQAGARRVTLAEFANIIEDRNCRDGQVCIDDVHAVTGQRTVEFVPHLEHYSTPRSRNDLHNTILGIYGRVTRKRKTINLKKLLRKLKGGGGGISNPQLVASAPIFDTFETAAAVLSEKISSSDFPLGMCVGSRDFYIPPQALNGSRIRINEIIEALRADCGRPPSNRDRIITTSHKYGSPKENISRGKFSMPRQVNTKKRLAISGRGVLSIFPLVDGVANIDRVAIPLMMYESFFGPASASQQFAIVMCYPINTLAHTPVYQVVPWAHDTIGVPSNFLAPQSRDFDGDCAIIIPILDQESAWHAKLIGSPARNIFSGVDFVVKPAPHIVLGSGMTKGQLFTVMFERYTRAVIAGDIQQYIDWYIDMETRVGQSLAKLKPVSLAGYMFGDATTRRLQESKATRFDTSQFSSLGDLGDVVVPEGLADGVLYSNLFKVYTAGRRVVVESKCNIGDEGKKQNIIQFALPDIVTEWDFSLTARGRTISNCFIDMLPVIHKLPTDCTDALLDSFAKYLEHGASNAA